MGDHRAGVPGSAATTIDGPQTGQRTSQPYVGRRVAQVAPPVKDEVRGAESLPYAGRRVAGRNPVIQVPSPASPSHSAGTARPAGRRIALDAELVGHAADADDVVGHLLRPTAAPALEPYVGRRIAPTQELVGELITEPMLVKRVEIPRFEDTSIEIAPVLVAPVETLVDEPVFDEPVISEPLVEEPVVVEPVVEEPVVEAVDLVEPVLAAHPELTIETPRPATIARRTRPGGRRVASRRARVPSLPLLAGVAVLAISAGGALQAVHPDLAGADANGRIKPANALSGSSAVGSASLLGRGTSVSRSSDRTGGSDSLQAAADAAAKERDAALSAIDGQAEKRAAQIKLHQWVLPVAPGVYHLTARFGEYSYLWSSMHTGLDFAAPTGTPIMAVAGGTITEVGYSGAYGNRTVETLPDGTELWYCHQNEFGTEVGATVKPGQVIGYIGSTGNVTGPHLHLEVHPGGGDPVDPYTALQVHGLNP
jgi:murein DD-endopeptidase MepM/ murein hydrolase activator NlpD